jgi:DNA-directed RNA polymerase specialized sigma24 family protein
MPWIRGEAGKWDGGRIWRGKDRKRHFMIRRKVDGVRYELATGATTLPGAMDALRRFELDPARFGVEEARRGPLYLDDALTKEFLAWSLREKRNTTAWVARQRAALAFWADHLRGVDLKRMDLRSHVLPAIEGPGRARKVRVLKAFLSWLRKVRHSITAAEDVTFGTLSAPQSRPEQWKREKAVPKEHVDLALEHLGPPWRDALTLQVHTGWHVSEVSRFVAGGSVEPLPRNAKVDGSSAMVVCPQTKGGGQLRTRVTAEAEDAARRLLQLGRFKERTYYSAIASACAAAKVPAFAPGTMRHSVATWAVNAGADPAAVSAFLGHKSEATTKRFYATLAVPARVPTPRAPALQVVKADGANATGDVAADARSGPAAT